MRSTSFGLGLAAAILAILMGLIFFGVTVSMYRSSPDYYYDYQDDSEEYYSDYYDYGYDNSGAIFFGVVSGLSLLGGGMGMAGAIIARKKRSVPGGVLMLVSAGLSLFSIFGIVRCGLFIAAGVLALNRNRQPTYIQPEDFETEPQIKITDV